MEVYKRVNGKIDSTPLKQKLSCEGVEIFFPRSGFIELWDSSPEETPRHPDGSLGSAQQANIG